MVQGLIKDLPLSTAILTATMVTKTRRNGRLLWHEQNGNEGEAAAAVEEATGWTGGDREGPEWREPGST